MSLDTALSLTTADEVFAYMGEAAERDAFWAYFTGTSGTNTIQIIGDTLKLIDVDNGTTTFDLTNASYDTLTELVAAINLIAGWEAGLIYAGSADSDELVETGALDADGVENEQTMKIKDVYLVEQLINRASDFLNKYCNRHLKSKSYTHERYTVEGTKLQLYNYPVTEITQISDGELDAIWIKYTSTTAYNAYVVVDQGVTVKIYHDGTLDGTIDLTTSTTLSAVVTAIAAVSGWSATIYNTSYNGYPSSQLLEKQNLYCLNQDSTLKIPDTPLDNYTVDFDAGIVEWKSGYGKDFLNVIASYKGGYASGSIPYSLEQICIELVKYKYDMASKDSGLKSEQIGRVYQYTLADIKNALPEHLQRELDLYKKVLI